ncbi:efflux RND transporter periplasmic adaptor subunit [Pelotalea chapellei]|uniref:Efflux RND transporter periplasmic adaptor subunit n=1 Tax=Pelotalea chapellei TaxID=44671 RepID=A0ABS5UAL6_9BACT|nr:efflux RND transporter periplasmic adaptor subunit [Pelotalea chapellei]MBT1072676.1 efflux RND transporter periplasmic adaptor subunit [Pelotalea chapellei]
MRTLKVVFFALLIITAPGCGKKESQSIAKNTAPQVQGATVSVLTQESLPEQVEAVGSIKARNIAIVSARISGSVTGVYVKEGDRVSRGKPLVTIEASEGGAAAAGALSGVQEAERGLDEARSRKKLADATFQRFSKLYNEQAVTRQEFEVRQMEQEVAAQGVARAEARLNQAGESAKAAGAIAGYGKVVAPVSGIVVAKQVDPGQTVFPGTPLVTIEGEDGYRLEVAAPEGLLSKVHVGDNVAVILEGGATRGRVAEVVPTVDPGSRTFLAKLDISARGLRSGSYGKALFKTGARPGVAVPTAAVVERGALTSVWVVSRDGIARLRLVKLGKSLGDRIEVLSGLSAGERIVTAGMEKVSDGARVEYGTNQ